MPFSKASKEPEPSSPQGGGLNTLPTHIAGIDNSFRLLKREGVIDSIPNSLCPQNRESDEEGAEPVNYGKNVILIIGDGMGWEMIRAGAVVSNTDM